MLGAISIVGFICAAILVYAGLLEGGWLWSEAYITIRWGWTGLTIISALILMFILSQMIGDLTWRRNELKEKKQRIMEAIEHNKVEVLHIKPSAAVSVYDDAKGEEIACCYDMGNNHILCVNRVWGVTDAQYFDSGLEWPNDCFDVVLTTKHGLVVGIFCHGEKVQSVRQIDFNHHGVDEVSNSFMKLTHPIAIFEGSVDNVEEVVKKEPIKMWE